MSAFLLEGSSGDLTAEQTKEIHFIRKAAESLTALVNDLLDLAKVEAGKAVVRSESFEVADLLETLNGTTRTLLADGSVALIVEPPVGIPPLQTDEGKIAQILRNFLSNAAKFTERGEIRLSAKPGPHDTVIFSVTDTGIGINLLDQRRVFEEFTQVEGPVQKRVKGTGLGLPLSRKLAELLGGGVSVRSEPGVGSTFYAVIPRIYVAPDDMEDPSEPDLQLDPQRLPVLVVEDDVVDLMHYEKYLHGSQFQIVPARTLVDARRILRRILPTAVILDVLLDAESGWTLLTELRAQATTKDLPIFVLTVVDGKERALSLGATDFCIKPVDRAWLMSRLNALAERAEINTILIIDDQEADRYRLKGLLIDQGKFAIIEAGGGEEGLRYARETKPDVIFLDLIMTDMTGFEVLEHLKTHQETQSIPVIINTSSKIDEPDLRRLVPGAAAILSKSTVPREEAIESIRNGLMQAGLSLNMASRES
jgi:CheY-like chemotaxis protein